MASLPSATTGHVTFGSFNNLAKVSSDVISLWAQILSSIPKSRLILKDKTLTDPAQRVRLLDLFSVNGVQAERIELLPKTAMSDYLATYGSVDIGLDPFPYNGCTTSCEALWMGVPVVTLAGIMSYSRFGVSLLSNVGLEDLIALTPEEYVTKAVGLAENRKYLAALRSRLRSQMASSHLCDARVFVHSVEDAYRLMWRQWCQSS